MSGHRSYTLLALASLIFLADAWNSGRQNYDANKDQVDIELCYSTGSACMRSCPQSEGDFQSCQNCSYYMHCHKNVMSFHKCHGDLAWDDQQKDCVIESKTCTECVEFAGFGADATTDSGVTGGTGTDDSTDFETESTTTTTTTTTTPSPTPPEFTTVDVRCGSELSTLGDQSRVPNGWSTICYVEPTKDNLDIPCSDFLQNLPNVGDADGLLASGGSFGCMLHMDHPDFEWENVGLACRDDDYQRDLTLGPCGDRCAAMSTCLKYAPSTTANPRN